VCAIARAIRKRIPVPEESRLNRAEETNIWHFPGKGEVIRNLPLHDSGHDVRGEIGQLEQVADVALRHPFTFGQGRHGRGIAADQLLIPVQGLGQGRLQGLPCLVVHILRCTFRDDQFGFNAAALEAGRDVDFI